MKRDDVLLRFCRLAGKVREHQPLVERAGQSLAADCFCDQSVPLDPLIDAAFRTLNMHNFEFDEDVMAFIERAVESAMAAHVEARA